MTVRSEIEQRLDELALRFKERYGDDLSHLSLVSHGEAWRVVGEVVVEKQRVALRKAMRGLDITLDVACITDPGVLGPYAVLEHPDAQAISIYSRSEGGKRVSEWLEADGPARLVHTSQARYLVQLVDGTVGWVALDSPKVITSSQRIVAVLGPSERLAKRVCEAEPELSRAAQEVLTHRIPYLLGGRNPTVGIDCSALVQHLIFRASAGWLPRHTTDQMKVGVRVARTEIGLGDLIFARARTRNFMHVGLSLPNGFVVHACMFHGHAIRESFDEFFERYRYLRTQRVFAND